MKFLANAKAESSEHHFDQRSRDISGCVIAVTPLDVHGVTVERTGRIQQKHFTQSTKNSSFCSNTVAHNTDELASKRAESNKPTLFPTSAKHGNSFQHRWSHPLRTCTRDPTKNQRGNRPARHFCTRSPSATSLYVKLSTADTKARSTKSSLREAYSEAPGRSRNQWFTLSSPQYMVIHTRVPTRLVRTSSRPQTKQAFHRCVFPMSAPHHRARHWLHGLSAVAVSNTTLQRSSGQPQACPCCDLYHCY